VDFRARCAHLVQEKRQLEAGLKTESWLQTTMESEVARMLQEKLTAMEESQRKLTEANSALRQQNAYFQRCLQNGLSGGNAPPFSDATLSGDQPGPLTSSSFFGATGLGAGGACASNAGAAGGRKSTLPHAGSPSLACSSKDSALPSPTSRSSSKEGASPQSGGSTARGSAGTGGTSIAPATRGAAIPRLLLGDGVLAKAAAATSAAAASGMVADQGVTRAPPGPAAALQQLADANVSPDQRQDLVRYMHEHILALKREVDTLRESMRASTGSTSARLMPSPRGQETFDGCDGSLSEAGSYSLRITPRHVDTLGISGEGFDATGAVPPLAANFAKVSARNTNQGSPRMDESHPSSARSESMHHMVEKIDQRVRCVLLPLASNALSDRGEAPVLPLMLSSRHEDALGAASPLRAIGEESMPMDDSDQSSTRSTGNNSPLIGSSPRLTDRLEEAKAVIRANLNEETRILLYQETRTLHEQLRLRDHRIQVQEQEISLLQGRLSEKRRTYLESEAVNLLTSSAVGLEPAGRDVAALAKGGAAKVSSAAATPSRESARQRPQSLMSRQVSPSQAGPQTISLRGSPVRPLRQSVARSHSYCWPPAPPRSHREDHVQPPPPRVLMSPDRASMLLMRTTQSLSSLSEPCGASPSRIARSASAILETCSPSSPVAPSPQRTLSVPMAQLTSTGCAASSLAAKPWRARSVSPLHPAWKSFPVSTYSAPISRSLSRAPSPCISRAASRAASPIASPAVPPANKSPRGEMLVKVRDLPPRMLTREGGASTVVLRSHWRLVNLGE